LRPGVGREETLTVDGALHRARGLDVQRLDALRLLGQVLKKGRTWLMVHGEHALDHQESEEIMALLQQRACGVPLAYLLGHREFHGLMLRVTPQVLDPRPDTETLVDWALDLLRPWIAGETALIAQRRAVRVADLGTGSGAIALALKAACPTAELHATDASAAALAVARDNAEALGLPMSFHEGHWWQALGGLRFDLVVSNPPYIREGDPHLATLVHEPRRALVAGEQGLAEIRAIVEGARAHLYPRGWLLLEHGFDQAPSVGALLQGAGFTEIDHRLDLAGHTRCTGGRLPR